MVKFPPVPAEVKPLAHLLKLAEEHDERNVVVAYWARMSACLLALSIVPGKKTPETAELIRALLDWLEKTKKVNSDNEGITSDTIAQSLIEEYALQLFQFADQQDQAQIFNKNTIKTFYTSGMLMDVLDQFGPIPDDIREKRKYAKWKAAYIHNCLKAGERPLPGPPRAYNENNDRGIVHNSQLSEEELSTYTKYTGPINIGGPKNFITPASPPMDSLIPFNPPKQPDDNFAHAPASSPITPLLPTNPTPFSTPNPTPLTPAPPNPVPSSAPVTVPEPVIQPTPSGSQFTASPDHIQKAQKYCKFATSALNYDDVKNAMDYLRKAMNLLELGKEE
ncbi:hypothetical protein JTB14_028857 [Gonioctena quinquepunctata]|nr:hypothetical protein JTB14_028857 [Gonioctena quinquepunctata]